MTHEIQQVIAKWRATAQTLRLDAEHEAGHKALTYEARSYSLDDCADELSALLAAQGPQTPEHEQVDALVEGARRLTEASKA